MFNLFVFCGRVSERFIFVLNLILDILTLTTVNIYTYNHCNFSVYVSQKYEPHLRRLFLTLLVVLSFMIVLNIVTYIQQKIVYFANNVVFLTAKVGLCVFVLTCFVLEFIYKTPVERLLRSTGYIYASIITFFFILKRTGSEVM